MKKNKTNSLKTMLKTSKIGIYEVLFSLVFAAIFVIGHILITTVDVDVKDISNRIILGYIGSFIATWGIALFILTIVKQWALKKTKTPKSIFLKNLSDKKLWLFTSIAIFICYLPLILMTTSVLSPDSWNSLAQVTGLLPLSNGNPLIFTAFVSVFIHIGLFFGSLEFGTLLFSLAQSAILAIIFARVIVWMRQEKIGTYGIIAALIFYAILPVNAIAGIIMWKDILFAGFGLLFLIALRKLYIEKNAYFTPKNIAYFISLAFLFCTFRNNGLYAYGLFFVLVLILNYRTLLTNKKFLILLFTPIVLALAYLSFIVPLVSKPTTASYATLCVPMQQIARTVKYHSDSLTTEEKKTIGEILPIDRLGDIYNPGLSDPVMGAFNAKAFDEDKEKYLSLWASLLTEHPKTFFAATMYNTYGYVYPYYPSPTTTDIVMDNTVHPNAFKDYSDDAFEEGNKQAVGTYNGTVSSIVPIVHSIGFYTTVTLLAVYIAITRKKRELVGVFIILFSLFISTILGPVNGEFRYLYLFVVALPFILGSVYVGDRVNKTRLVKK